LKVLIQHSPLVVMELNPGTPKMPILPTPRLHLSAFKVPGPPAAGQFRVDVQPTANECDISPPSTEKYRNSTQINNISGSTSPMQFKISPINSFQEEKSFSSPDNYARLAQPLFTRMMDEKDVPDETESALGLLLDIMDRMDFHNVQNFDDISQRDWKRIVKAFKDEGGVGVTDVDVKQLYAKFMVEQFKRPEGGGEANNSSLQRTLNRSFSSDEETDQPSGQVTYRGKNTPMSSTAHRSFRDKSVAGQQDESSSSRSYLTYGLVLVMIAGLSIVSQQLPNPSHTSSVNWDKRSMKLRAEMKEMKQLFQSQSSDTIKLAFVAIDTAFQSDPFHPGVLTIVARPAARATAECFLRHLVSRVGASLDLESSDVDYRQFIVNGSTIARSSEGKAELSNEVERRMAEHGLAAISSLESLSGWQALCLHGLADDSTAPYKNAVLLMTVEGETSSEICQPSGKAEKLMLKYWDDIPKDQLTALISRLTMGAVELEPESQDTLNKLCPIQ